MKRLNTKTNENSMEEKKELSSTKLPYKGFLYRALDEGDTL